MKISSTLFVLSAFTVLLFTSCHRKTAPATTRETTQPVDNRRAETTNTYPERSEPSPILPAPKTSPARNTRQPIIVVDSKGSMVASREQLKANGAANIYDEKDARAFTTAQRKNLISRFKIVPPRVLFVPPGYVKSSNRGEYYILKDKFWYWKKSDGYFYLDETYYN